VNDLHHIDPDHIGFDVEMADDTHDDTETYDNEDDADTEDDDDDDQNGDDDHEAVVGSN